MAVQKKNLDHMQMYFEYSIITKSALSLQEYLTISDDFNETFEMRQYSTSHQDTDLLYNLDSCMSSLP